MRTARVSNVPTKLSRWEVFATGAVLLAALLASPGCRRDDGESPPPGRSAETPRSLERVEELPEPVLEELEEVLSAYEAIRSALAQDRLRDVSEPAARIAASLEEAGGSESELPSTRLRSVLAEGARTASAVSNAEDLAAARVGFGELSRLLLVLANVDPRLAAGWHVYSCPMTTTFPKWIQPDGELENPFMGRGMSSCGVESDTSLPESSPLSQDGTGEPFSRESDATVAYYTCSMHPSVRRGEPGTCPICSMDLVAVTREELETGVLFVDAQRRQAIGVRTAPVGTRPMSVHVRAAGRIVYDETRLAEVSVKYRGWVGTLYADASGVRVREGEPLFTLYSPELYAAQEELLTALASREAARETSLPDRADYLVEAARKRLRLWDVPLRQIDEIERTRKSLEYLPIVSPATGYVVEKNVVQGASVEPGETLYRIAGLDTVWVEAEVYESDLARIEVGQRAEVTLAYLPGKTFAGRVSFIYPFLEGATRTGTIRVELANPGLSLKPDMYANVDLGEEMGERLVVPEEAVLYAGPRRLVFLDLGEGRLRPQEVEVGVETDGYYEVLSGLQEGDVVVTSGNFLIAAESRLKSAEEQW